MSPIPNHFELNVSRHGLHIFATDQRSATTAEAARELYELLSERFLASDGFQITITHITCDGHGLSPEQLYHTADDSDVIYRVVKPERPLAGAGTHSNRETETMRAFMDLPGATTDGLPLAAYVRCAKDRGHSGFVKYAIKYGWLRAVGPPIPHDK